MKERPIRLMHVVEHLGLGGMEYGVIKLVNRLNPRLVTPMICTLSIQAESTRGLLHPHIPVFEFRKYQGYDRSVILKLVRLLRHQSVDILHSHNWTTMFYAVVAAAIARTPILIHGEHGREAQAVPLRQLRLQRWLTRGVTHLTTVSTDLAHHLVEQWKVNPELVTSIPNGVDHARFGADYDLASLRREFNLTDEHRIVLAVGRIRPVKDLPTLVRGFAQAYRNVPTARLFIVGKAYGENVLEELGELAEKLGVGQAVIFLGERQDIPQLYALCDVYANTSHFEGMSNTILEAMAVAKPVIATAVGGNPELVSDGVTGYLIPEGDDQLLAERLERLLTNTDLSGSMGQAARRRVEQEYSLTRMAQRYTDIYRELFDRHQLQRTVSVKETSKIWISRFLHWSGITRLKDHVGPAELTILTYHRVLPLHQARQYAFQGMVTPRDIFDAQMAYLSRRFNVLTFPEAIHLFQKGQLPRRAVVVTFDDGYGDNHEYAAPVMQKYRVSGTVFVVTGVLDRRVHLWWDQIAEAVQLLSERLPVAEETLDVLSPQVSVLLIKLNQGIPSQQVSQEIVHHLNTRPSEERQHITTRLGELAQVRTWQGEGAMLTWEQVRDLSRNGMTIGSHTVTHAFLDEVTEDLAGQEIEQSIARIEHMLGEPVEMFAYPRGRFDERAGRLLQKAGVEAAVTTVPGRNRPGDDLFRLKRIDSGYSCLRKGFDAAVFEVELQGWFTRFRHD